MANRLVPHAADIRDRKPEYPAQSALVEAALVLQFRDHALQRRFRRVRLLRSQEPARASREKVFCGVATGLRSQKHQTKRAEQNGLRRHHPAHAIVLELKLLVQQRLIEAGQHDPVVRPRSDRQLQRQAVVDRVASLASRSAFRLASTSDLRFSRSALSIRPKSLKT